MLPGRRIARAAIAGLSLLAVGLTALALLPQAVLAPLTGLWPLGPTPPPPTITAPAGEPPVGAAGLAAWARYRGEAEARAGSGFLLRLADDRVVGVLTAHSVTLGDPARVLEGITFTAPGSAEALAEFERLLGPPGRARTGGDMTVDYILLSPLATPPAAAAWEADPRGGPQPGERVTLYGGAGAAGPRGGTVLAAGPEAVWAVMDETFDPGLLSGSPLVSAHTGQVVGMTIAAATRGGRLTLAFHPVGSLVRLAQAAADTPALAGYRP